MACMVVAGQIDIKCQIQRLIIPARNWLTVRIFYPNYSTMQSTGNDIGNGDQGCRWIKSQQITRKLPVFRIVSLELTNAEIDVSHYAVHHHPDGLST